MTWRYDRIYVGTSAGGLEHLVSHLLPRVREIPVLRGWFFLRYVDSGGVHLRLRTRAASQEELDEHLEPLLRDSLETVAGCPLPWYRPAIPLVAAPEGNTHEGNINVVTSQGYDAELDKYGHSGIAIAEALFEQSSDIAVDVVLDEQAGVLSRKTLVPLLMQCAADAFQPANTADLWLAYTQHWLRVCRAPEELWMRRFRDKAQRLRASGVRVLPESCSPALSSHRDRWHRDITAAARAYREDHEAPSPRSLAMNFAHLMNNRLGVLPLEEAYYGTLIAAELVEET